MHHSTLLIAALLLASTARGSEIYRIPFPASSGLENATRMMLLPEKGSPIIWILGTNGCSYEFNPQTNGWRNLESVLGKSACFSGRGEPGVLDEFRPNVLWLPNFHLGLVRYEIGTEKSALAPATSFERAAITTVVPEKDRVWVGTSKGLYSLTPDTLTATKISAIPDIWVRQITVEQDRLWINGEYILSKKSGRTEQIYSRPGWKLGRVESFNLVGGYKFFANTSATPNVVILNSHDETVLEMDRVAGMYAEKGRSGIWLSGSNFNTKISLFDPKSNSFKESYSVQESPGPIVENGNYLLFLGYNKLIRLNRKTGSTSSMADTVHQFLNRPEGLYLLTAGGLKVVPTNKLDEAFAGGASLQQEEAKALELARSTYAGRLVERIKATAKLFEVFDKYPQIQWAPQAIYNAQRSLKAQSQEEVPEVEELLQNGSRGEQALACYALLANAYRNGDPNRASDLLSKLLTDYPDSRPQAWITNDDKQMVSKAAHGLSDIRSRKLPPDEELWLTANLFFDTMGVTWNEGEVGWDSSLATKHFNELLERFPASRYAANAEYKMLSYVEGLSHEGGDNSWNEEAIRRYKAILDKYPDSDVAPEIGLKIAGLYFQSIYPYESNAHDFKKEAPALTLAMEAAKDVMRKYPQSKTAEDAKKLLERISNYLAQISWSLTIRTDKEEYSPGDPVVVSLEIKNLGSSDSKINVSEDSKSPSALSHLVVYLPSSPGRYETPKYVRALSDTTAGYKAIVLQPNEAHHESFDLTRRVRPEQFNSGIGQFVLDRPGRYVLKAFFPITQEMKVISNEVTFNIK